MCLFEENENDYAVSLSSILQSSGVLLSSFISIPSVRKVFFVSPPQTTLPKILKMLLSPFLHVAMSCSSDVDLIVTTTDTNT